VPGLLRVPFAPLAPGPATLPEPVGRYVARVHRLREGDSFLAFDPALAVEAEVEILSTNGRVECRVGAVRPSSALSPSGVTLLQCLGKGDKPERVIGAATALGADHVVLVESSRTVVHVADRAETRLERFHSVAVEAARQSGRGNLPTLTGPMPYSAALERVPSSAMRVCLAPDAPRPLGEILCERGPGQPVALLIGPEGGLSPDEIAKALALGFVPAALGPFVLRTETAAVAALGAVVALAPRAR